MHVAAACRIRKGAYIPEALLIGLAPSIPTWRSQSGYFRTFGFDLLVKLLLGYKFNTVKFHIQLNAQTESDGPSLVCTKSNAKTFTTCVCRRSQIYIATLVKGLSTFKALLSESSRDLFLCRPASDIQIYKYLTRLRGFFGLSIDYYYFN
jgi:hypothetical protein